MTNLIRQTGVKENKIWNCDEKGIIMGLDSIRMKVIVHANTHGAPVTKSEASREYVSVLETVNIGGKVIPPFIIWQVASERGSFYKPDDKHQQKRIFRLI